MSYSERQAGELIEAIRASYELARESLEIGNIAPALGGLDRIREEAEALYELHLTLIREELLILEPLARRLEETLTRLGAGWAAAGDPARHPATPPAVGRAEGKAPP